MTFFRPSRILIACLTLFCMLYMQLAMAAYVCPGQGAPAATAMADCVDMDMTQPALCHAHMQNEGAKQSLDKAATPDVAPFIASALAASIDLIERALVPHAGGAPAPVLARSTAPPIAIRHCCFRI
ncbi:MAG: hypothetical protein V4508_24895 [Pseudomonadota bacterium]